MNFPENIKYTKSHEWVQESQENTVKIGLTDFAQQEMGDIVFVNLPTVGDKLVVGETFADIESVKAVEDVYSPVTGVVAAVNDNLLDNPAEINNACYNAWLVEVEEVGAKEELLTAQQYEVFVNKEA